jgi:PPK2 family polyphosphate:nucleotide phosphotransferase
MKDIDTDKFLVKPGAKVKLLKWNPGRTGGIDKPAAAKVEAQNLVRMEELQNKLYAQNKQALLVILQTIDAGGKDGTIRKVMSGVNPQGCQVTSFKVPSQRELAHDFLWRIHKAVPARGMIGIFNRSHYEDVLVVRVHGLAPKNVWSQRYEMINDFERTLAAGGVRIVKFFLHISKDEQLKRFKERIADPTKQWKLSQADFDERKYWDDYMAAYEDALSKCSTPHAPWYVIPANHKWFRNMAISQIVADTLEDMKPQYPPTKVDVTKLRLR